MTGLFSRSRDDKEARRGMKRTERIACLLLSAILTISIAAPAVGAPIDEKRAEAVRIKAQVDELDQELEVAAEDYNEAKGRYDEVSAQVKKTEKRLGEIAGRQSEIEAHLSGRVTGMYRQGPLGTLRLLLGATSFEEFSSTWELLENLNIADSSKVSELKALKAELRVREAELAEQQAVAKAEYDTMAAQKKAVEERLAERERLLRGVQAEIAEIEREQRAADARRAAAARSAAQVDRNYSPPSNAPRSEVVKIALSKLGSPYRWAAAGPDAFDCSGFTMWCYARVGVSLPHSSRAQINYGQRVSRADLAPGDLVFFGKSGIHHVGIYIGGGNFVHAPHTGDVVKVSSLGARSDYVGACRP